ncbi:MAG: spermidine synthase [Pseudomonadota bacterium]
MEHIFEELDYQQTEFGEISLRRRTEPRLDNKLIYEVKLGDEFLMSSLFVEAEEQLAVYGIERLAANGHDHNLDIVVGGLGLGYTSLTAMQDKRVGRLRTIDVMQPVISWHQQGILPIGDVLATNPKSELIHGDFFAIAGDDQSGFGDNTKVDAVLLDIDHSPRHWLNEQNSSFYCVDSLQKMAAKIKPSGVFALWSNELPDEQFVNRLNEVFDTIETHIVSFANPYSGHESTNSVYVCSVR